MLRAVCRVGPKGRPCSGGAEQGCCSGTVWFEQTSPELCRISWHVTGLTPGLHGLHVHETADFSRGCASAGPHYNPFGQAHGGPGGPRHVGDLGNILADPSGVARGELLDDLVKLSGPTSVVGRSVMVHADEDDLGLGGTAESRTTGTAGARVACGEILAEEEGWLLDGVAQDLGRPDTPLALLVAAVLHDRCRHLDGLSFGAAFVAAFLLLKNALLP
jgi:Cu-Zn family superoxide dismutase